jgi:SAM-dependent methyltransferase
VMPLLSNNQPPLPYPTGYFDVIYSVSVFTHLRRAAFDEWMTELVRCLRPGGLAMLTFHGRHAFEIIRREPDLGHRGLDTEQVRACESEFLRTGFMWAPQATGSTDIDTTQYGITFTDESRIGALIPRSLSLIHYGSAELGNWQDVAVLERCTTSA